MSRVLEGRGEADVIELYMGQVAAFRGVGTGGIIR